MSSRSKLFRNTKKNLNKTKKDSRRGSYRYKPGVGDKGTIRVLRPKGAGFYIDRTHWVASARTGLLCTSSNEMFGAVYGSDGKLKTRGMCVCCFKRELAMEVLRNKEDFSKREVSQADKDADTWKPREYTIVEVIDFNRYHLTKDSEGKDIEIPCKDTSRRGRGGTCAKCRSADKSVKATILGGKRSWKCSKTVFNHLEAEQEECEAACLHVHGEGEVCGGEVYLAALTCPSCESEMYSEREMGTMSPDELASAAAEAIECPHCREEGAPEPFFMCSQAGLDGVPDHEAEPGSIFDQNYRMKHVGETMNFGKRSVDMVIPKFSTRLEPSDILEDLKEAGVSEADAASMSVATDFDQIKKPGKIDIKEYDSEEDYVMAVLDHQAKILSEPNPFRDIDGDEMAEKDDDSEEEGEETQHKKSSRKKRPYRR